MMKIIKVSHNSEQVIITIQTEKEYQIHLYSNNHTELHSRANDEETALEYHEHLCKKCSI
jgi:hypothetical protein